MRAELAAIRAEAANMPRHVAGLRPDGSVIYDNTERGTPILGYSAPPSSASAELVSIDDHPAARGDGGGSGGGSGRRRGSGGRASKAQLDDFAKEVEAVRNHTAALEAEAKVLVGALLGYDTGGYTGNRPADEVAGFVHGGEYVFSKQAVDRIGIGALEALHRGKPGFMSGGLVPGCEGGAEIFIERKAL